MTTVALQGKAKSYVIVSGVDQNVWLTDKVLSLSFPLTWNPDKTKILETKLYVKWSVHMPMNEGQVTIVFNGREVYNKHVIGPPWGEVGDEALVPCTLVNGENRMKITLKGYVLPRTYHISEVSLWIRYDGEDTFQAGPVEGTWITPGTGESQYAGAWPLLEKLIEVLPLIMIFGLIMYVLAYLPRPRYEREYR